jgi:hypothetical protein
MSERKQVKLFIDPDAPAKDVIFQFERALKEFGVDIQFGPIEEEEPVLVHCKLCGQLMDDNTVCPHPVSQEGRHLA